MAETAPSTEQSATPTQTTEQTSPLETVYKQFPVEEAASQFQPARQETPAPVTPKAPDPFDPNFQNFIQSTAQSVSALNQTLHATRGELTAMQQQLTKERTEADISRAADTIAKEAGIKPKVAAVALELKAREDARFLAIWNNRQKNPQAFNAALKALATETSQEYAVRQDPQLTENQRAVRASQQTMATTTKPTESDKWESMTQADRQREIRRLITSGG